MVDEEPWQIVKVNSIPIFTSFFLHFIKSVASGDKRIALIKYAYRTESNNATGSSV